MLILSAASPLGVTIGLAVEQLDQDEGSRLLATGLLQALAAGTILYVVFFEILAPEPRSVAKGGDPNRDESGRVEPGQDESRRWLHAAHFGEPIDDHVQFVLQEPVTQPDPARDSESAATTSSSTGTSSSTSTSTSTSEAGEHQQELDARRELDTLEEA
ncbi:Zinc transporter ZIP2 [Amphibalanus amphitrite]|uniref:Zinc transporter ZIP2 n=1 Tax=Amphibalanus amphitrite TaxID=1232801 RepID=A0A6A4W8D2_AMPAM|nr:Zinc transporter ZIP2 [Amphibalanus amphitrite]